MVLETLTFSAWPLATSTRECGGKDQLTQCCWHFCKAGMWFSASVRGNLWLTLRWEGPVLWEKGEVLSLGTPPPDAFTSELWHARPMIGLELLYPVRVVGWQCEVTVVAVAAQGLGRGSSSCSQELWSGACPVPSTRLCCSTKICMQQFAYHPRVLVRSWGGLTRGLMPKEQETWLSWESWEGWRTKINVPWQGEHSHKQEDSLCMSYALYTNETTDNPLEIFRRNSLAMPI